MKRFFAVVSVLLLMLACLPAALAEGPVGFIVDAPAQASAGDTVTVRVSIAGEYEAHILNMRLNYDPNSLEFVSISRGPVLEAAAMGMAICERAEDKPYISTGILMYGGDGVKAEGMVFEAAFKVLQSASSNVSFDLEIAEFGYLPLTATVAEPIEYTVQNASMKVSGAGGGASITPEATVMPIGGGDSTEPASATPAPTDGGAAEGTPEATGLPVLSPGAHTFTFEPGKIDGKTKNTDAPVPGGEGGERTLSGPVKGVIIGLGCLLAVGLGWLTVHFFKKGREAGREARGKK